MNVSPEILRACLKNDQKALEQLYKYCFKLLMPACFRFHRNEEDARSSLNLGFMKIVMGLPTIDAKTVNFDAWSKRIMNNMLIDEYRKNKKQWDRYMSTDDEKALDYFAENDVNQAVSDLGEKNILDLVAELPAITGQVFCLYVIEGYAHKEIGDMLEIPEGTSKWHLSQARKLLREKLEKLEMIIKKMAI